MKKLLILLFSILISFNSYGETETYYYENGQIESEANYKDGKYDGTTLVRSIFYALLKKIV